MDNSASWSSRVEITFSLSYSMLIEIWNNILGFIIVVSSLDFTLGVEFVSCCSSFNLRASNCLTLKHFLQLNKSVILKLILKTTNGWEFQENDIKLLKSLPSDAYVIT